jgi:predicted nucleotidyltransferase component of viral defense system
MAEPQALRRLSAVTGLGLQFLARDEKLSLALEALGEMKPGLVLKGGTALNRVHLAKRGASRFSEDIDLDTERKVAVHEVSGAARKLLTGTGVFDVEGPRRLHDTLRFDCLFTNEFGERDRIRVEIHLGAPGGLEREDTLVKSPFVESHPTIFKVYKLEGLLAMKLVALRNRAEGKDMYDVYHALDLGYGRAKLSRSLGGMLRTDHVSLKAFRSGLLDRLKSAEGNSRYIMNATNHFIPVRLRPDWRIFISSLEQKIRMRLVP